jgi:hypothetical protein
MSAAGHPGRLGKTLAATGIVERSYIALPETPLTRGAGWEYKLADKEV